MNKAKLAQALVSHCEQYTKGRDDLPIPHGFAQSFADYMMRILSAGQVSEAMAKHGAIDARMFARVNSELALTFYNSKYQDEDYIWLYRDAFNFLYMQALRAAVIKNMYSVTELSEAYDSGVLLAQCKYHGEPKGINKDTFIAWVLNPSKASTDAWEWLDLHFDLRVYHFSKPTLNHLAHFASRMYQFGKYYD